MTRIWCAVKALIWKNDAFLMVSQRVGDKILWDLPGGRMEFGETPLQALTREVREETGLEVRVGKLSGVWWFFRVKDGDQVVCLTYDCSAASTDVALSKSSNDEELTQFKWVTPRTFLAGKFEVSDESFIELIRSFPH